MNLIKILKLICILIVIQITPLMAQWQWAYRAGDTGADVGKAVCKDPSGNIYLTGEFKDAAPAGGVMFGGFNLTGSNPIFTTGYVVKYNASGNAMWAFPITSTGHVLCQAIHHSGNFIYVTGSFAGTANFGNGFTLNTGNSLWSDVFILKVNATTGITANVQMKQSSYMAVNDVGFGVYASGSYVYVTGDFETEYFVSKYDIATLTEQWTAVSASSNGGTDCYGASVVVDGAGNVFTYGSYAQSTDFMNSNGSLGFNLTTTIQQAFIAKYNASGIVSSFQRIGFNSNNPIVPGQMDLDGSGNVYVGGSYGCIFGCSGSIYLESGNQLPLTYSGDYDGFIGKYDNLLLGQWARKVASSGTEDINGLDVESNGDVFYLGSAYNSTATIGCITLAPNPLRSNFFFGKYDTDGNVIWAHQKIGNSDIYQHDDKGIVSTGIDEVALTVFTWANETFGTFPLTNVGNYDIAIAKFRGASANAGPDVSICSGESFTLTSYGSGVASWTGPGVNCTNCSTVNITPTATGTYTLSVDNPYGCTPLTDQITVTVNPGATVNLGPDLTLCNGPINLNAGSGFVSYDWTLPGVCLYGGQFAQTCVSGTYCVTVENSNGCTASDCVNIILGSSPSVTATATPIDPCQGETVSLGALSACTNCTYLWSTGAQTPGTTVNPTVSTTYTVTITNSTGCTSTSSVTVNPIVCEQPPICKMIQKVAHNDIGEAVVATADGGCAIAGTMFDPLPSGDRDMYFVKYDAALNGGTVISKRIGGSYADEGYSVLHRPGDGYYIAGTAILSSTEHNIYVAKLREDGVQLWGYMYGTDNNRIEAARKIIDMSNPNEDALMIVGFTNSTSTLVSNFDVLALKIRTNGTLIAQNTFGGPSNSNDYGNDAARYDKDPVSNEYYIVGERALGAAQDAIIVRVNQNLTYVDSEIIDNHGRNEVANAIAILPKTNGADLFIAGSISNNLNNMRDLYIFKLTTTLAPGASPNSVVFGNTSSITYEVAYKMKITNDNKLILAAENGTNTASGFDALALKVDPATLGLDWASSTDLQGINEVFKDIAQLSDGSYVGTGFYTVSSTDRDILVSRINDTGESCCLQPYAMSDDKTYSGASYLKPKTPVLDTKGYGSAVNYYQEDKICTEVHREGLVLTTGAEIETPISILPNPNSGEFTVALLNSSSTIKAVNIYDISGRIVKNISGNDGMISRISVSIAEFDSGIYFVELTTTTDDRYTSRVVVQK